jgi:hypothetical protein
VPEEMSQMRAGNPEQPGDLLPQQYSVFKTDFRERYSFFFVSDMIEEEIEAASIFGDVDDDSFLGQCFEIGRLGGIHMNIGED